MSDLFSPAVLSIPCLALGVLGSDEPGTYRYCALVLFGRGAASGLLFGLAPQNGRVHDFHLPDRRDRIGPFAVAIASALLAAVVLFFLGAPDSFLAPVITALAQTVALCLITLFWQISIHSATTAGLVTYAVLEFGPGALVLTPLVPLVVWARLYLGRHTPAQVTAGVVLGCAAFGAMFAVRGTWW